MKDGEPMSSIEIALKSFSTNREVLPVYYHRPTECWIVTGIGNANGGAVIVDAQGQIMRICSSKREAVASLHKDEVTSYVDSQDIRGSRAWAEQQIRLATAARRPLSLRRINAFLVANDFPKVGR